MVLVMSEIINGALIFLLFAMLLYQYIKIKRKNAAIVELYIKIRTMRDELKSQSNSVLANRIAELSRENSELSRQLKESHIHTHGVEGERTTHAK